MTRIRLAASLAVVALVAAACGDGDAPSDAGAPTIAVTTNILGDVVEQVVGDAARVVTVMPVGVDPHDFQPSAQEVDALLGADAVILNGAGFEEGLLDAIDNAESSGIPMFSAVDAVDVLEGGHHDHDDEDRDDEDRDDEGHDDEEHDDEGHDDEDRDDEEHDDEGHDADGIDPHVFTDPARMAVVVEAMVEFLVAEIRFDDAAVVEASGADSAAELRSLDAEIAETLAGIADDRRVLVTSHEVFGYFADRYDFEVVGVVVPGGATTEGVSAGELAELADTIAEEAVPAIFTDAASSDQLARTLAAEVGDVAVVELFSESLGDDGSGAETYVDMMRLNARRIADALG